MLIQCGSRPCLISLGFVLVSDVFLSCRVGFEPFCITLIAKLFKTNSKGNLETSAIVFGRVLY